MDGERLAWEGGYQYFRERFPFAPVLRLAAAGLVSGAACAVVLPRRRGMAMMAVAANLLWAAWWARHPLICLKLNKCRREDGGSALFCEQHVHKLTGDFRLVASISDCGIFGG